MGRVGGHVPHFVGHRTQCPQAFSQKCVWHDMYVKIHLPNNFVLDVKISISGKRPGCSFF